MRRSLDSMRNLSATSLATDRAKGYNSHRHENHAELCKFEVTAGAIFGVEDFKNARIFSIYAQGTEVKISDMAAGFHSL